MLERLNRSQSLTWQEVGIGAAVVCVVLGGLAAWFGSTQHESAQLEAEDRARRLLGAATDWVREHGELGCPSVSQLIIDRHLSRRERTDDPWGGRFRIQCTDDGVRVLSAGSDGKLRTDDDVTLTSDIKPMRRS